MKKIYTKDHLPTLLMNVSTIMIVAIMLLVTSAVAKPSLSQTSQFLSNGVLSYQGTLLDHMGNPFSGNVDIRFAIYDSPTSTSPLWLENRSGVNSVPVSNGLFNILLGSLNPIPDSVWSETELYLGISVGSDAEMLPRDPITLMPPRIAAGSLDADLLKPFDLGYKAFPSYWIRHGEAQGEIHFDNKVTGIITIFNSGTCSSDNTWCCNGENNICIKKNPSGDDTIAFRLDTSHSLACWLAHEEDDGPENSEGLKIATNSFGTNPFGDNIPSFYFMREGLNNVPIDLYASYFILCLK